MFTQGNLNIFKDSLIFIQEFLGKKQGGTILFFASLVFGFWYTGKQTDKAESKGVKIGKEGTKNRLISDSIELRTLNGRVAFYKMKLDSCEYDRYSDKKDRYDEISREIDEAKAIAERNNQRMKDELKKIKQ